MKDLYKNVNGTRIKMTPEEVKEWMEHQIDEPAPPPDPIKALEQQVDDLNLIMAEVLGGGM